MATDITKEDLELIQLGDSLGLDLVSFANLRASQEDNFTDEIRQRALEKLKDKQLNLLKNRDSFYVGSIDFMIYNEPEGKSFFLLETNGGSHRGLSILTEKQQALLYDGYYEAIMQSLQKNKSEDGRVFVLIGIPVNDALIHEKVILIEYLRKKLKKNGNTVKIFNTDNYDKEFNAKVIFLIADYNHLSMALSFSKKWIKYKGREVGVILGDGITRRMKNKKLIKIIKQDFRKINSIIINPIFRITDDKSLTYLSSFYSNNVLKNFNLKPLLFTKVGTKKNLIKKLEHLLKKYQRSFIIKPSGGSGGAGVIPISAGETLSNIKTIVQESKKEFFTKFRRNRDPFPYTIQEKADFSLVNWKEGKHTFDIRIYLAQRDGKVIPIGGLARIARLEYIEGQNKQEFVVNLSGFNGQVEVERGVGLSYKNCKFLGLSKESFVNMFCIGCVIFASIDKYYNKIVNFSDWNTFI